MVATDVSTAINARLVTRVEYGIDPRGWSMVAALNRRLHGGISGRGARPVLPTSASFHGVVATPQQFRGLAQHGMGTARPRAKNTAMLTDVRDANAGTPGNPGLSIFAERTRRRQR